MPSNLYDQQKLNNSESEIRLIDLSPGEAHSEIVCELRRVSLDGAPRYNALSYTWGDPSRTAPITVNGILIRITINLEAALRAIRNPLKQTCLWVDAICINQDDTEEKSVQVPLMGSIYSRASEVLVWLGPATRPIECFLSLARRRTPPEPYQKLRTVALLWKGRPSSKKIAREHFKALAREGFYQLFAKPYWGRMWTLQEIVLSRNDPLCFCGNLQPFRAREVLIDFATYIMFDEPDFYSKFQRQVWSVDQFDPQDRPVLQQILDITQRSENKKRSTKDVIEKSGLQFKASAGHMLGLAEQLVFTSTRLCSDPRDKVFGLYGLNPDLQKLFPVDYNKDITQIKMETVAYLINHENYIQRYPRSFLFADRLSNTTYPSWFPDFSKNFETDAPLGTEVPVLDLRHFSVLPPLQTSIHQLTEPPTLSEQVRMDTQTLHLWARSLGKCKVVTILGPTVAQTLTQIRDVLVSQSTAARKDLACLFVAYHGVQSSYNMRELVKVFKSGVEGVCDGNCEPLPLGTGTRENRLVKALENLSGKTLLVTDDGCMGVAVSGVQDGDVAIYPPRVQHPLIIRAVDTGEARHYKMVGTAIIDKVMTDRLYDATYAKKVRKREFVEFVIR
ncbi:heterokaryon incompatibility protein-domain-containing protein [Nemania sp. FL0031]|nr:heterokaryon incompatibility protein-domain-containing protein [Nemania sp. FL0031]